MVFAVNEALALLLEPPKTLTFAPKLVKSSTCNKPVEPFNNKLAFDLLAPTPTPATRTSPSEVTLPGADTFIAEPSIKSEPPISMPPVPTTRLLVTTADEPIVTSGAPLMPPAVTTSGPVTLVLSE